MNLWYEIQFLNWTTKGFDCCLAWWQAVNWAMVPSFAGALNVAGLDKAVAFFPDLKEGNSLAAVEMSHTLNGIHIPGQSEFEKLCKCDFQSWNWVPLLCRSCCLLVQRAYPAQPTGGGPSPAGTWAGTDPPAGNTQPEQTSLLGQITEWLHAKLDGYMTKHNS